MNPWQAGLFNLMRDVVRFALWFGFVICALMFAVFSVAFTYQFLSHAWTWCRRVLFTGGW
jgi:hypothetical protein